MSRKWRGLVEATPKGARSGRRFRGEPVPGAGAGMAVGYARGRGKATGEASQEPVADRLLPEVFVARKDTGNGVPLPMPPTDSGDVADRVGCGGVGSRGGRGRFWRGPLRGSGRCAAGGDSSAGRVRRR